VKSVPLSIKNHILESVRQVPSPNCSDRPDLEDISLIVIHSISLPPEQYGGDEVERFFCNQLPATEHAYFKEIEGLQVSAHLFIRRTGEVIQFVPFDLRAWHAGASCHQGRQNCNDFSIGIEMEGTDTGSFESEQYRQLANVIRILRQAYPQISAEDIVGHSDIAPGRKADPGSGFEWGRIKPRKRS